MDKSDKKSYGGCLIFICIFAILAIFVRWRDDVDESKSQRYQELMDQIAKEPSAEKAIVLFNEAYENATSRNERRKARSGVIVLYEQLGNYSMAHHLLDEFIEEFESSKFTDIHRALLFVKEGKKEKAIEMLELVLNEKKDFEEPGMVACLWDSFISPDSGEKHLTHYYDYFFDYVCNMVALGYESYLITDSVERLKNKERLFLLNPQIDDVAQSYINYKTENPKSYGGFEVEKIDIMQKMHLGLWTTAVNTDNLVEDVYRMKWNFATFFLMEYDKTYGYQLTKQKMSDLLETNHTTSEKFPKFLIDAYMSLGQPENKSQMTYDDFKSFHKEGLAFLIKLTPTTLLSSESSFIKEGITDSRILLRCNDWEFSHGTNFLPDSVAKYRGMKKQLVLLSDDYKLDTISIESDRLGARIEYVFVPTAIYELLLHDFSRRVGADSVSRTQGRVPVSNSFLDDLGGQ